MADKMRLLELCMRETSAAFGWGFSGTHMAFVRGRLSFLLTVSAGDDGLGFVLYYRYTAFDRIYHELTGASRYPGIALVCGEEAVDIWSLMGISEAMKALGGKVNRFADDLSERITSLDDNLDFLEYFVRSEQRCGRKSAATVEYILTALLKDDAYKASSIASGELLKGNRGTGFTPRS